MFVRLYKQRVNTKFIVQVTNVVHLILNKIDINKNKHNRIGRSKRTRKSIGKRNSPLYLDVVPDQQRSFSSSKEETKYVTGVLSAYFPTITTTPIIGIPLNYIATGTDVSNRLGRHIRCTGLKFHGTLAGGQSNIATDDKYNTVRISVVKQNAQTASPLPGLTLNTILDPRNSQCIGLEKTFYDKCFLLESPGRDSTGYMPALLEVNFNLKFNVPVFFAGTGAGTVADEQIIIACVSDSVLTPSPGFVSGAFILSFEDF